MKYLFKRLYDKAGGEGGGVGTFEARAMQILEENKRSVDALVKDFDRLDGDTKKAFEGLTAVKNGLGGVEEVVTAIKKVQMQLKREQRMAFGSGVRRILADDEKRTLISALIRRACSKHNVNVRFADAHKKALDGADAPGSTYYTDVIVPELYDTLAEYGVYSSFAQRRLGAKANQMPVKTSRPVAYYTTAEGAPIPEDTVKSGTSVSVNVQTAAVLLSVSNELLQDSVIDVPEDVLTDFFEAIAYRMDWSCLQGTGANDASNGNFTGIFTGGVAIPAAATHTSVAKLTLDDVIAVLTGVDEGVLNRRALWWIHPRQLARMLSIKDANGRSIFLTAFEAPTTAGIGSILGYPVIPSYAAPSADGASAKIAAFGDPNGLVHGIRSDFEFASSQHASFNDNETVYRGLVRHAAKIRKAGAFGVLSTPAA